MKPKKIRVIKSNTCFTKANKVYKVIDWEGEAPIVIDETGDEIRLDSSRWEPISEFNIGDIVWAWDTDKSEKIKGYFIGVSNWKQAKYAYIVEDSRVKTVDYYVNIEHYKPTMTLQELADKAGVNLDEVEIKI